MDQTMRRSAAAIATAALILSPFAVLSLSGRDDFTGVRLKEPDGYTLDARRMSGRDTHTLTLEAGDVLQVSFQTQRGHLCLEIQGPDGTPLYAGNGTAVTDFEVDIPESGVYTVAVAAQWAAGSIRIRSQR